MNESLETFPGGLTFSAGRDAFPLSTDTMLLGSFVKLRPKARVVDLGSGSGALGLLLCGLNAECTVTGVELHGPSHEAALANIARNQLEHRMESIPGDLRQIRQLLPAGSYQCVVSNPPYFADGAPSASHACARQESACTLEQLFGAAAWLLQTGGDFYLVHKPHRLADLLVLARQYKLEAKTLQFVRHRAESPVSLVLLHCRRGARPGLVFLPELILYGPDGTPTAQYRKIYHLD